MSHTVNILHIGGKILNYLLNDLSIFYTVCHNGDVGVGDNSQYNHFTISKREHSLVIHIVTVNFKRTVTHLLNSKAVQWSAFSALKFPSVSAVHTSTICDRKYNWLISVLNISIFCTGICIH